MTNKRCGFAFAAAAADVAGPGAGAAFSAAAGAAAAVEPNRQPYADGRGDNPQSQYVETWAMGGGGLTQSPKDVPHDVYVTHGQPIHSALYFVYVKKANKTLPAHARSPTEGTKQTTAAVVVAFSPP